MNLERISDNIYVNMEGKTGGNVGIILLEDAVAAVDAQYPVSGVDFRNSIKSVTQKPVTHLLLTHYHGDHVLGSLAFEDCEVVAHRLLYEIMEENLRTIWAPENVEKLIDEVRRTRPDRVWLYEGLRVVMPTRVFDERFSLNGVELIHLGGHTAGSTVVYVSDERLLFAGDLLFAGTFPWAGDPSANPDTWITAFESILSIDVETIIPGHGTLCDKSEVRNQLDWFRAVRDEMKNLIGEGATMKEAIEHDGYPRFYEAERKEWRDDSLKQWYRIWSVQG